jgi:hypothetical protein
MMKKAKLWCGAAALLFSMTFAASADNQIQWGSSLGNWFDHSGALMQAGANGGTGWLVQLVYAGSNGVIDRATGSGFGVTGDDVAVAWAYFDSVNWGQGKFIGSEYVNTLPNGSKYYFRAWEGVTAGGGQIPAAPLYHGESMLFTVTGNGDTPIPDVFEPNVNLGGSSGPYAMTTDLATTAVLAVQATPGGSVTGGGTYIVNNPVQITATASNLWLFTGWNDSNTNASRTVVVPSGGATYTANFTLKGNVVLQASPGNGGSVLGGGIHTVGSPTTIVAQPNLGWRFANWSDGDKNSSRTISVADAGTNLTADFVLALKFYVQDPAGNVSVWVLNNLDVLQQLSSLGNMGAWKLKAAGDVNRDGKAELFWQQANGLAAIWWSTNDTYQGQVLGNMGSWEIKAVGDVDGDGIPDVIWQMPGGLTAVWYMNSNGTMRTSAVLGSVGTWKLKAAGDVNRDGKADLFWQQANGLAATWWSTNGTYQTQVLGNEGTWEIKATGDLDGDGIPDVIWQTPGGQTAVWYMNSNGTMRASAVLGTTGAGKILATE